MPRRPVRLPMKALGLAARRMVVPMDLAETARRRLLRAARIRGEPASDGRLVLDCAFRGRILRNRVESLAPARINMLWLRI